MILEIIELKKKFHTIHPVINISSLLKLIIFVFPLKKNQKYNRIFFLCSVNKYIDIAMDWSDHALWWPSRNCWLTRTRSTLDQYGVQADALLHFTPMHKLVRLQLPDLRYLNCKIDFSVKTFNAVIHLCKELGKFGKN